MNSVVFEHVKVSELPPVWRAKLPKAEFSRSAQVTVRIEQEVLPADQALAANERALAALMANPMVGMWADRKDMADVPTYVRALRAPRLNADGTRRNAIKKIS